MKVLWKLIPVLVLALALQGCKKENRVAKDFDGTWSFAYQWSGGQADNAEAFGVVGSWNMTSCKTTKEDCFAVYSGDDDDQLTFSWGVEDGAESISVSAPVQDHFMFQFAGTYDIFSQTDSKVVLISNDCNACGAENRGTYTVELTK